MKFTYLFHFSFLESLEFYVYTIMSLRMKSLNSSSVMFVISPSLAYCSKASSSRLHIKGENACPCLILNDGRKTFNVLLLGMRTVVIFVDVHWQIGHVTSYFWLMLPSRIVKLYKMIFILSLKWSDNFSRWYSFFLVAPWGLQYLGSPTRERTWACVSERTES